MQCRASAEHHPTSVHQIYQGRRDAEASDRDTYLCLYSCELLMWRCPYDIPVCFCTSPVSYQNSGSSPLFSDFPVSETISTCPCSSFGNSGTPLSFQRSLGALQGYAVSPPFSGTTGARPSQERFVGVAILCSCMDRLGLTSS